MNWRIGIQKLSVWPPARQVHAFLIRVPVIGPAVRELTQRAVPRGMRIWVDIRAGLGKGLALHLDPRFETDYATGRYETRLQKALSAHLRPGSVVYDVGAHIGVVSMFASQLVGSTGKIFAFEADPENASRIEAHVQRNNLGQIRVFPCAVWSSVGQLSFERASAQSGRNQGRVAAASGSTKQDAIVIESISLDSFAQRYPPPALIKIDVEGAEAEVLRGAEQTFSRSHPVVICEVHHRQAEEEVCRWLSDRGYSLEWLDGVAKFPRHLLARAISDASLRIGEHGRKFISEQKIAY
jgi:FkbM family methyltransferase